MKFTEKNKLFSPEKFLCRAWAAQGQDFAHFLFLSCLGYCNDIAFLFYTETYKLEKLKLTLLYNTTSKQSRQVLKNVKNK